MRKKILLAFFLVFAIWITCSAQQVKNGQVTGRAHTRCELPDRRSIIVEYPSIHVTGHKGFGGMDADEGAILITDEDLVTVNATIPAGKYILAVVPHYEKWMLVLNKHIGDSTTPQKYASKEFTRVAMSVTKVSIPSEHFAISFDRSGGGCMMHVRWENTQASVELATKNTDLPVQN
jgi:DUF2911 family protein